VRVSTRDGRRRARVHEDGAPRRRTFRGTITACFVSAGQAVSAGDPLFELARATVGVAAPVAAEVADGALRPELSELLERRAWLADAARPDAVERRHARGRRTARENVADLCDEGSFVE